MLRQALRCTWRAGTGVLGAVSVGGSVYFLYKNDWDVAHLGAVRLARAAVTVGRVALDYKWSMWSLDDAQSDEYRAMMKRVHARSAERLLALCKANGGCFIKVGQHCGSLEYLLPEEYTTTLSILHSKAPESPFEDICRVVENDLMQSVEEVFEEFHPHPLGAASLAQVYKAKLKNDGSTVAVKVQHPYVKARSMVDIVTMEVGEISLCF